MTSPSKLPDERLVSPAVMQRFTAEAEFVGGNTSFWALIRPSHGHFRSIPNGPTPEMMQQVFAQDMLLALNRRLHHDGAWVLVFTDPPPLDILKLEVSYDRWAFVWIDRDGDPQFTIENDDQFDVVLSKGPDHWIEQCEQAWKNWNFHMRKVLAPSAAQTFKRAQGQTAPSSLLKH